METPRFQASSPQNCEKINVSCFKPPVCGTFYSNHKKLIHISQDRQLEYFSTCVNFILMYCKLVSFCTRVRVRQEHEHNMFKVYLYHLGFLFDFVLFCCGPQRSENFLHLVFVYKKKKHNDWPIDVIVVKAIICMTGTLAVPCD